MDGQYNDLRDDDTLPSNIEGSGGGGKGGSAASASTPVAYKQTLKCRSEADIIELLCEGPILGPVGAVDAYRAGTTPPAHWKYSAQSVAYDNTRVMALTGGKNFHGYQYNWRLGYEDQDPINQGNGVKTEVTSGASLPYLIESGSPVTRSIDVPGMKHLVITLNTPTFYLVEKDTGNYANANVWLSITIQGDGAPEVVSLPHICGQSLSAYNRQITITNIDRFGPGPYTVILTRTTDNNVQQYYHDLVYWASYTAIVPDSFIWPWCAMQRTKINAKQFGSTIPLRSVEVYGYCECPVPSCYEPWSANENRTTGTWDGTWHYEWTDNPAWCFLAMLINERFGLGRDIADLGVLKWQLLKIAKYCDEFVYVNGVNNGRRWTFNHVIQTRAEAYHVINQMASAFVAMPVWASNQVLIMQDAPHDSAHPEDINASHIANASNVIDGVFNYAGSSLTARHTVARVTWNDPADFGRPAVALYEDAAGIARYGYRPVDVVATGCNNYPQAMRYGRWVVDNELNQGDVTNFVGDMNFGDCQPGNRILTQDPHYALFRYGGRVAAAENFNGDSIITLDDEITLTSGVSYTLSLSVPIDSADLPEETGQPVSESPQRVLKLVHVVITPGATVTTDELTIDELDVLPGVGSYWAITSPSVSPRYFTCLSNAPQKGMQHKISGLLHDYTKYARIYNNVNVPAPETSDVPSGVIAAPTALAAHEFAYESGNNWRPALHVSWTHTPDPRIVLYRVEYAVANTTAWKLAGETHDPSFNIQPAKIGTYDIRVRGQGTTIGTWATLDDVAVAGNLVHPPDVTGIQAKGGGATFTDRALHLEWTTVVDEDYMPKSRFWRYKIRVYDMSAEPVLKWTKLRTHESWTFKYSENIQAFGTATRQFKISVVAVDIYRNESAETLVTFSNAEPSMAGFTPTVTETKNGCKINWTEWSHANIDLDKFLVYCHTTEQLVIDEDPSALVATVGWKRDNLIHDDGMTTVATHYAKLVPYDKFGEGTKSSVGSATSTVPEVTNVLIAETAGRTFADRDAHIVWDHIVGSGAGQIPQSRFLHYEFKLWNDDATPVWKFTNLTVHNSRTLLYSENMKYLGSAHRTFNISIRAVDIHGNKGADTKYEFTNAAPDMSAITPVVTELAHGCKITWLTFNHSAILDLDHYKIYCHTTQQLVQDEDASALVATLGWKRDRFTHNDGIKTYATHKVKIVPYDKFGIGIASQIAGVTITDKDITKPIIVDTGGLITAGDGVVGIDKDSGITIAHGSATPNMVSWTATAVKLEGTDHNEYVCIQSHISTVSGATAKPPCAGSDAYWELTGVSPGTGFWAVGNYYHADTEEIAQVYGLDDAQHYKTYGLLRARGDLVGSDGYATVYASAGDGKTATATLRAGTSELSVIKVGTAAGYVHTALEVQLQGGDLRVLTGDIFVAGGGLRVGSSEAPAPAAGNVEIEGNVVATKVSLGTTQTNYDLSFGGDVARNIRMERTSVAESVGNTLTIQGCSAAIESTDKSGGDLELKPGRSTGSAMSGLLLYGSGYVGASSGTDDRYATQLLMQILGNKLGFWGQNPVVQQSLALYSSVAESTAYTTTGDGSDIASKTDLNLLRAAYENLREMCEDLRIKLKETTLVAFGSYPFESGAGYEFTNDTGFEFEEE